MSADLPELATAPDGAMWAGSYDLPNGPRSPRLARMLVRQSLLGCPPDVVDSAEVMVSELVTNAVRHAETDLVVHIALAPTLRVAVEDRSFDPISARITPSDHDDGRGLAIVEALAKTWGWNETAGGKQIWFEL